MRNQVSSLLPALLAGALALSGCSMDVKKGEDGKDKNVDIRTPVGALKVKTDDVQAKDVGVAIYPGATPAPSKDGDHDSKANVNVSTPWFGVKVIALKYETPDSYDKVIAFYDKELQAYGPITRCQGNVNFKRRDGKDEITCKERNNDEMKLVVGDERRHRIVAIKRLSDAKTEFALVYVNTRGEDSTL